MPAATSPALSHSAAHLWLTFLTFISLAIGAATLGVAAETPTQTPARRPTPTLPTALAGKLRIERDLVYAEPEGHPQHLDLFVPKEGAGPFPLVVWIHGGGWQSGSRAGAGGVLRLTPFGYAAASIDYRLTDVAKFPAQIEDCKAAIRWLRAHAAQYRIDPDRIGVWGASAGGHLVALLGTTGNTREFDVGANLDVSSRVQAVCDFYGPSDFLATINSPNAHVLNTADGPVGKLLGGPPSEMADAARRASPVTYVAKDNAPFLIVHGTLDPTVPPTQSQILYDMLMQTGVEAQLHFIPGAKHGGPEFSTPEVNAMIRAFFDRHLKPVPKS
jgi:acetyl esterase/lipase